MSSPIPGIIMSLLWIFPKISFEQVSTADKNKYYSIDVPADAPDWTQSSILLKKGDFVVFEATGTVDLGLVTKNIPATGSSNYTLRYYNRFEGYRHGVLLCRNGDEMVPAIAKTDNPAGTTVLEMTSIPLSLKNKISKKTSLKKKNNVHKSLKEYLFTLDSYSYSYSLTLRTWKS